MSIAGIFSVAPPPAAAAPPPPPPVPPPPLPPPPPRCPMDSQDQETLLGRHPDPRPDVMDQHLHCRCRIAVFRKKACIDIEHFR